MCSNDETVKTEDEVALIHEVRDGLSGMSSFVLPGDCNKDVRNEFAYCLSELYGSLKRTANMIDRVASTSCGALSEEDFDEIGGNLTLIQYQLDEVILDKLVELRRPLQRIIEAAFDKGVSDP